MILSRHPANPILTREDIPAIPPRIVDPSAVFNPGAVKHGEKYLLMLRVQTRGRETYLQMAESNDGVEFMVAPDTVAMKGIERGTGMVYHVYDPRITPIEGAYYIQVAVDMEEGCRLGTARTEDFQEFEFLGIGPGADVRNGVLFPEKIGGQYVRLDRPNQVRLERGVTSGDAIWLSTSDDLVSWTPREEVMRGRLHYWDELIGSGPPPVKTREGWLHVYHGVATHFANANIYQAGVALLDLEDPSRVLCRSHNDILEPRELYEQVGQVPNVVFPSGMIVEGYDAEGFAGPEAPVFVYYGAADTCIGLATTTVGDLLSACRD